jgi:polyhydroxybutyrate depolymerase
VNKQTLKCAGLILIFGLVTACNRPDPTRPINNAPATATKTGSFEGTLTSGNDTRHYLLHVPASYQAGTPAPLVINFHGYGSNATQEEALSGMSRKADAANFLVVYPDGLNHQWSDGPGANGDIDRQFVRDLIQHLQQQYTIDPRRIYATGMSNGGGMANRVGCDLADVIAAIAPVSGAYSFWQNCQPARSMPVLAFHGKDDHAVPYEGTRQRALEPPIHDWAAAWAQRNHCTDLPAVAQPAQGVTREMWSNCANDAEVILYVIDNHGHSWPGSDRLPAITSQAINATDVMWDFFTVHPLPER